ncbi:hypothetical protein [Paracoccus marcusii]|uniref:hypothetical protein n=1 Tax=Paracoccus marcusii TaxID=59779 RepID=UPI00249194BE|nr:hypothetical protein [Paracoccus marcusii]
MDGYCPYCLVPSFHIWACPHCGGVRPISDEKLKTEKDKSGVGGWTILLLIAGIGMLMQISALFL